MSHLKVRTLGELMIKRAYARLLSLPERAGEPRMVPLAQIGDHEIRMVESSRLGRGDVSLCWIETYDRDGVSTDGCSCRDVREAAAALGEFMRAFAPAVNDDPREAPGGLARAVSPGG
jgi:hypothetical protein